MKNEKKQSKKRHTYPVSEDVFKLVYDSPKSLPGQFKWITPTEDVRKIEKLLNMRQGTIGAPLWLSGDCKSCPNCKRETSWLDIVASAVKKEHSVTMVTHVILGKQKYVNTEIPDHIADLQCFDCGFHIENIFSFKCHNWAYAIGDLQKVILEMKQPK